MAETNKKEDKRRRDIKESAGYKFIVSVDRKYDLEQCLKDFSDIYDDYDTQRLMAYGAWLLIPEDLRTPKRICDIQRIIGKNGTQLRKWNNPDNQEIVEAQSKILKMRLTSPNLQVLIYANLINMSRTSPKAIELLTNKIESAQDDLSKGDLADHPAVTGAKQIISSELVIQ